MTIQYFENTHKNQIQDTAFSGLTSAYLLTMIVILCMGIISSIFSGASDFAQDYLAASAIRDGINPNVPLIHLAPIYGVPASSITSAQNAHPPLVILLAVPFTYFPWETAHFLWHIQLSMIVGALWIIRPIRLRDLILLSPAWVMGMCIGNIDVVVICLCLAALSSVPRAGMAVMLGLAAALKVYPLLLIAGLCAIRQYRLFFIALVSGAFLTLVATLYSGFSSLTGWLFYIPHNINLYALNAFNMSLTKLTSALRIDNFLFLIPGMAMVYLQKKQKSIEPLLAGMLLVAPLSWLHQLPVLSNRLRMNELIGCSVCCVMLYAFFLFDLPQREFILYAFSILLTGLIVVIYIRLVCHNSVTTTSITDREPTSV